MRRSLAVLAGAPLLMATTCIRGYQLEASPRPERGRPAITASFGDQPVAMRTLAVQRCRPWALRHISWEITRGERADSAAAPNAVVYGELPGGFTETHRAEALPAGCYELTGYGDVLIGRTPKRWPGWGGFHVAADGIIVPGPAELNEAAHYNRQWARAAVGCRRAYRRIRTTEQYAAVDARVYPVADTTVTCELLRTRLVDAMRSTPSTEQSALVWVGSAVMVGAVFWLQDVVSRSIHLPK